MSATLERVELSDARWRDFASRRTESTIFHGVEWPSLLARTYGYRAFGMLAKRGGQVIAGAPFLAVGGPLRQRWVSLPFTDACAPLGEPDAVSSLVSALEEHARTMRVATIEFRSKVGSVSGETTVAGFQHVLTLSDAVPRRRTSAARERNIRHAQREGVAVTVGRELEDIEAFYRLHLRTRRRLGVPVQPIRFFRTLWQSLIAPGFGFVATARLGASRLAAAVFLASGPTLVYKFGASDERTWSYRPNDALFDAVIKNAKVDGYSALDFGRTDAEDDGLRRFKSSWGADERELTYTRIGARRGPAVDRGRSFLAPLIRRSSPLLCRALGEAFYRYTA